MHFEQIHKDDIRLIPFMEKCKLKHFNNNTSIKDMKFDHFEHSAFFAGIQNNEIKTFSGVHNFDYNNERYWRVAFRAVSLYDDIFKPVLSKNWRVSSIHMGVGITLEMKWVEERFGPSKFVITSNEPTKSVDSAGMSHLVDRLFKSNKISGARLMFEHISYLHTIQNVWLLDQNEWYSDYEKYYKNTVVIQ